MSRSGTTTPIRPRVHCLLEMDVLLTVALSTTPIGELRAGLPFALARGLPPPVAYLAAVAGNLLVAPVVLLVLALVTRVARRLPAVARMLDRLQSLTRARRRLVVRLGDVALLLLVALPLPGTGAWTATLVAHLLGVPRARTLVLVSIGVFASGVFVLLAGLGILHLLGAVPAP